MIIDCAKVDTAHACTLRATGKRLAAAGLSASRGGHAVRQRQYVIFDVRRHGHVVERRMAMASANITGKVRQMLNETAPHVVEGQIVTTPGPVDANAQHPPVCPRPDAPLLARN